MDKDKDKDMITPFINSVEGVLGQFGIGDIKTNFIKTNEEMVIDKDITAFVGIVGAVRGNVSYCFSIETGKKLAGAMMMGMPVDEINDMIRSALAELSNMLAGNAITIFAQQEMLVDITPPTVVVGEDMFFILSFYKTVTVSLETSVGNIEMNIGLEI